MKKKIISLLIVTNLIILLTFGLTSCNKPNKIKTDSDDLVNIVNKLESIKELNIRQSGIPEEVYKTQIKTYINKYDKYNQAKYVNVNYKDLEYILFLEEFDAGIYIFEIYSFNNEELAEKNLEIIKQARLKAAEEIPELKDFVIERIDNKVIYGKKEVVEIVKEQVFN